MDLHWPETVIVVLQVSTAEGIAAFSFGKLGTSWCTAITHPTEF
jgi:hypothetical protein